MDENLSAEIEKAAEGGSKTKASWAGILSINLPALNLGSVEYHLRAGKAKGDQEEVHVKHIDKTTNREVVSKEVSRLYRYTEDSAGKRSLPVEITYGEAKQKVRYGAGDGQEWRVSVKSEKRFFDKELLEKGEWKEVPINQVVDIQDDTDQVEPFDRTQRIEVTEAAFVPLERLAEYRVKEVYQLAANTDKKVNEDPKRVNDLARMLLDKQVALVAFFTWGRGYNWFTAVLHPYERKDGKLWLLMSLSEGILLLDEAWAIQQYLTQQVVAPVPVARKKPRVKISA
jgi:hypothetical protein